MSTSSKTANGTHRGQVIWFDDGKGYGFIKPGTGPDVFVHYTAIESNNKSKRRRLLADQVVEYELVQDAKGPMAHNVRVVTP